MRTSVLSSSLLVFAAVSAAPAQDDVLVVERRADVRAHAAAARLLRRAEVVVHADGTTPKQLCRLLTAATGERLSFVCRDRDSDATAPLTFAARGASAWSIMAIAQLETGLRFVFRSGVVFLVPADEVRPLLELRLYDLRAACAPLTSFPGPDLRLGLAEEERVRFPEPYESGETVSGFTADTVVTLLRETVQPESWLDERVRLLDQNGLLLIRQTPAVHAEIEATLVKVGVLAAPRVRQPSAARASAVRTPGTRPPRRSHRNSRR